MPMNKKECTVLRTLVNRANTGPAWFNDSLSSPLLNALHAELRYQTRVWLADQLARELQRLLPPSERVIYKPIAELQARPRSYATESAAPAELAQMLHQVGEVATNQARAMLNEPEWWPELDMVPAPAPAPARADTAPSKPRAPALRGCTQWPGLPCVYPECSCPVRTEVEPRRGYDQPCRFGERQCKYPDCGCP